MDFSAALRKLKEGHKIYRTGWNGKTQYLYLVNVVHYMIQNDPNFQTSFLPAIAFHGTKGEQIGWLASQADLLADDWKIWGEPQERTLEQEE